MSNKCRELSRRALWCVIALFILVGSSCAARRGQTAPNETTSTNLQPATRPTELAIVYAASVAHLSPEVEAKLRRIVLDSRPQGAKKDLWFIYWNRGNLADVFCLPDRISGRVRKGVTFRIWIPRRDLSHFYPNALQEYLQVAARGRSWPLRLEIPKPSVVWELPIRVIKPVSDEDAVAVIDMVREHSNDDNVEYAGESILDIFHEGSATENEVWFDADQTAGQMMFFEGDPGHYRYSYASIWVR